MTTINLAKKVDSVINKLKRDAKKDIEKSDLLGCFLDISEDLSNDIYGMCDWEHINYKLFVYFHNQFFWAGFEDEMGNIFLSKTDRNEYVIGYYLNKACDYILKN